MGESHLHPGPPPRLRTCGLKQRGNGYKSACAAATGILPRGVTVCAPLCAGPRPCPSLSVCLSLSVCVCHICRRWRHALRSVLSRRGGRRRRRGECATPLSPLSLSGLREKRVTAPQRRERGKRSLRHTRSICCGGCLGPGSDEGHSSLVIRSVIRRVLRSVAEEQLRTHLAGKGFSHPEPPVRQCRRAQHTLLLWGLPRPPARPPARSRLRLRQSGSGSGSGSDGKTPREDVKGREPAVVAPPRSKRRSRSSRQGSNGKRWLAAPLVASCRLAAAAAPVVARETLARERRSLLRSWGHMPLLVWFVVPASASVVAPQKPSAEAVAQQAKQHV